MPGQLVPRPPAGEIDLRYRDFRADRALGRASLYFDIANEAATAICGLYGRSPATMVKLIPGGSPLIDNGRGIFDDMCQDIVPPPAPPTARFNGGQCDSVRYNWTLTAVLNAGYTNGIRAVDRTQTFTGSFWGPVQSIELSSYDDRVSGPFRYVGYSRIEAYCRGDGGLPVSTIIPVVMLGSSGNEIQSFSGLSISRFDGQSDLCGNPAPAYPPPSATPSDFNKNVNITISPGVRVSMPLTVVPTFAPVVGIFRPEFNVNVGGINVNLSAGGFTFSPTLELPISDPVPYFDPRTVKPPALPISQPSSGAGPAVDLTPVLDKVKEVKDELDRCCDRLSPYSEPLTSEYDIQTFPESIAARYSLPSRTFRVTIQVVARPANEKIIVGNGSDDVLFCGWAWFDRGGGLSERLPIDAANKSYEPPPRSQGTFVYAMYAGYTAIVRAYYAKTTAKP